MVKNERAGPLSSESGKLVLRAGNETGGRLLMEGQGTSECTSIQVAPESVNGGGGEDGVLDQVKNIDVLGKILVVVEEEEEEERKVENVVVEVQKDVCVIDVKCKDYDVDEKLDSEKVCRICHLSSDRVLETIVDLIQLGCGCKEELGIAHQHCAETWFKLKGDRCCEICGQTAKNVTGVGDDRFMEEWRERRSSDTNIILSSERRGFWHGQTFCNFLMACLVIAIVLPWFFRVNTL